ncbi:MAG: guanylate kinase [Chlamydiales bacterium]|nr:guanylate kinase [Chlamydiales bacterium]
MAERVLGNLSKGKVFVLSAPAGTGKTTLVRMLREEFPVITESISCTTRPPRAGELAGEDYHFLTDQEFKERIKSGDFLEHAEVFGYHYGTSKAFVVKQQEAGRHVFLVIDTQGAMQLKKRKFEAIYIFISPPSLDELKTRLINRKTEDEESMKRRLSWAEEELKQAVNYDYHIVNQNLNIAYDILRSIVIAEEHRITK